MGIATGVNSPEGWDKIHRRPNRMSPLRVMLLGLSVAKPAVLGASVAFKGTLC